MKNFTFELRSFVYYPEKWNNREFVNEYGTWKISITSTKDTFSGFMILKPAFGIDLVPIAKLINVKFKFLHSSAAAPAAYNYEQKAIHNDEFLFYFNPFYSAALDTKLCTYKITVEVQAPVCPELKTSKGYLRELFLSGKLADVTIKTTDDEFKVHQFILARSDVFDRMLNNSDNAESQTGIIEIKDIKHEVIFEMCRFLYIDEIPEIGKHALELLIAADKYNIPGLAARCGEYLINNIGDECFSDVLVAADNLNIKELKDKAIDFIIDNRKTIFASEGWKNLKKNQMSLAMEVLEKFVANA